MSASVFERGLIVVTNQAAGSSEPDDLALEPALAELGKAGDVELATSTDRAELDQILDRRDGRPLVVVGGDGSLHGVVAELYARGELTDCPLGLLPAGTGNDLARNLGIPLDPVAAAGQLVAAEPRPLDLLVDDAGGIAINAVHMGIGAGAAQAAGPWKAHFGPLAFPLGALAVGVTTTGWRLRVEVDDIVLADGEQQVLMVGLANAPAIAGGAARLAPSAAPDDGVISVVVSAAAGPVARLSYAVDLSRGQHGDRPDVRTAQGRRVTVSGDPFPMNADGEVQAPISHRTWEIAPAAWSLLC